MTIPRLLLALVFGGVGGVSGANLAYVNHNPLYDNDPLNGTVQTQTPDNAWKWWAGLVCGAFIGTSMPFWNRERR